MTWLTGGPSGHPRSWAPCSSRGSATSARCGSPPRWCSSTASHWATFVLFGCMAAALLAAADRDPRLLAGLFVLFCCFEVAALALIAVLGEWLFEALPQWSIVIGNLLAAAAMLGVFFRRHRIAWLEFLLADE